MDKYLSEWWWKLEDEPEYKEWEKQKKHIENAINELKKRKLETKDKNTIKKINDEINRLTQKNQKDYDNMFIQDKHIEKLSTLRNYRDMIKHNIIWAKQARKEGNEREAIKYENETKRLLKEIKSWYPKKQSLKEYLESWDNEYLI